MSDTVLAVLATEGTETWVDQSLQDIGRLEKVSQQELGRIVGLIAATGASVVLVEMAEPGNDSLAIMTALTSAKPWVTLIALCRVADHDTLLRCMRAGARDCVAIGTDAVELRDRIRHHQLANQALGAVPKREVFQNLILVTSVSPRADSAFLTQGLALEMAGHYSAKGVLAIDITSEDKQVFHLDTQGAFDLGQLLSTSDTLDKSLIDTALEEFRPGLRLLAGGPDTDFLGDRGADLFIALSRLMGMFDAIVLHIGSHHQSAWVKAIGTHVRDLLLLVNPEVPQLRQVEHRLAEWRPHLSADSRVHVLLDGFESGIPPDTDEIASSTGEPVALAFPMEWRQRLHVINQGIPLQESEQKSLYLKKLRELAERLVAQADELSSSAG